MGHNLAADLASNPDLTLERSLSYHLTGNHYPPVPLSMVSALIEGHHLECFIDREED